MAICFQSLRSSSSGNCLALWSKYSSLLIDCGVKVQYQCEDLLDGHRHRAGALDGVLVSHAHGDHVAYGALRVLQRHGVRVYAHGQVIGRLSERHRIEDWNEPPRLEPFTEQPFTVGDFRVTPFEVPHEPGVRTFGFVIGARDRGARVRIVVCTDFHDYAQVWPHFVDADFIFVEANHDLELLRRHPNPASRWHLNNVKTASLLHHVVRRSVSPPKAVLLGHLSEERNRRRLATDAVRQFFGRHGQQIRFDLDAAPRYRTSEILQI